MENQKQSPQLRQTPPKSIKKNNSIIFWKHLFLVWFISDWKLFQLSKKMMEGEQNKNTITLEPSLGGDDDEDFPLMEGESKESPFQEFVRQRKMAEEACQLGRKYIGEGKYLQASKEFSKAVMTFEYIIKNNIKMADFKTEIASMIKEIIQPAYSNLSLCYTKMEKWHLVISFANQVLQTDKDNIKNIWRRGIARKMSKMYDQAIEDFEKVKAIDNSMKTDCLKNIQECRELKKQSKKKDKELAKSFISGYSSSKPQPSAVPQAQSPAASGLNWWQRGLKCLADLCRRLSPK